jgi:hypothetical protein
MPFLSICSCNYSRISNEHPHSSHFFLSSLVWLLCCGDLPLVSVRLHPRLILLLPSSHLRVKVSLMLNLRRIQVPAPGLPLIRFHLIFSFILEQESHDVEYSTIFCNLDTLGWRWTQITLTFRLQHCFMLNRMKKCQTIIAGEKHQHLIMFSKISYWRRCLTIHSKILKIKCSKMDYTHTHAQQQIKYLKQ